MQFFIVVTARFAESRRASLIIPYFQIASGTEMILAFQVAVLGANGESRLDGNVRQMIIFQNRFDQLAARFGVTDSFSHIKMKNRSAGIFSLQFVLKLQRFKSVAGMLHRNLRRVGVVRRFRRAGLNYAGENFLVFFGESVGGALGRRGFKIVKTARFLLIFS